MGMKDAKLHVYEINSGGSDFVVAESEQEAIRLLSKEMNIPIEEYDDSECFPLPDDKDFTIQNAHDDDKPVTKRCAEWASENGKGFIASTEW